MEYMYHICGEPVALDTRWNGLTHYTMFVSDDGADIDHCPQCREALMPDDIGITILSGDALAEKIRSEIDSQKWHNVETDGLPEQQDQIVIFVMKDHSVLSISTKILLNNYHITQVSSWIEHPGHLRE